jgi:lipoate-protein ligase B
MEIATEHVQNGLDEVVFITEHPEIYTAGRSFEESDFLRRTIEGQVYYPQRGGRITVHAPGQMVVYPIINLRKRELGVIEYVRALEDWIVRILREFSVRSFRSENGIGIWTELGKIGYIGVRVARGVSSHGFCINVNNDLSPFGNIIPCGLVNTAMTSLSKVLGQAVSIRAVSKAVVDTCRF